jgi:hypothetical protein
LTQAQWLRPKASPICLLGQLFMTPELATKTICQSSNGFGFRRAHRHTGVARPRGAHVTINAPCIGTHARQRANEPEIAFIKMIPSPSCWKPQ